MTVARVAQGSMPSPPVAPSDDLLVSMREVWKRFGPTVANAGAAFDLQAGEVHALLGENGAGKSTLMKVLAGVYRADAGRIVVDGAPVKFASPRQAIAAGIGMVHQHFRLVENLTVAENLHLGLAATPVWLSAGELERRAAAIAEEFGLGVSPSTRIWQLSTGEQQRVEILRTLARGSRVLILDEPTAVLTPIEARSLFSVMRALAASGRSVVFITHKLEEVLEASDRVTVMRGGSRVAEVATSETDARGLASMTVGIEAATTYLGEDRVPTPGALAFALRSVHATGDRGRPALVDVSLDVHRAEIVGVAGVAGNGQSELAEVATGLRRPHMGRILLDGEDVTGRSSGEIARAGVGHVPEDRLGTGLVGSASVADNAILRTYLDPTLSGRLRLRATAVRAFAWDLVKSAEVRTPGIDTPVGRLSGGNQQRLLVGRETRIATRLLVAVHPTRGLDVGATQQVHAAIRRHRDADGGVLLVSEDLDELLALADRIVVMYAGRIVGETPAAGADREQLGLLMGGASRAPEGPQ